MAVDLSDVLVVGISSRALFELEAENELFERDGIRSYTEFQLERISYVNSTSQQIPLHPWAPMPQVALAAKA